METKNGKEAATKSYIEAWNLCEDAKRELLKIRDSKDVMMVQRAHEKFKERELVSIDELVTLKEVLKQDYGRCFFSAYGAQRENGWYFVEYFGPGRRSATWGWSESQVSGVKDYAKEFWVSDGYLRQLPTKEGARAFVLLEILDSWSSVYHPSKLENSLQAWKTEDPEKWLSYFDYHRGIYDLMNILGGC